MSPAVKSYHGLNGVTFPFQAVVLARHDILTFPLYFEQSHQMIHRQDSGFQVSNVLLVWGADWSRLFLAGQL